MAISNKLQATLNARNADRSFYGQRTKADAQETAERLRETGYYRRVEVREFNNGSRARPLPGYFVNVWFRDGLTAEERSNAREGIYPPKGGR